jgi:hypothetical protein
MKKPFSTILMMTAAAAVFFLTHTDARAELLEFDLHSHPIFGMDPNALDSEDFGLVLDTPDSFNYFDFINVKMRVDTDAGSANIFGRVKHQQSGDFWDINSTLGTVSKFGDFTGAVPNDTMFQDLLNHRSIGNNNDYLIFNNNTLSLTPVGAIDPISGFQGPRQWSGKGRNNNTEQIWFFPTAKISAPPTPLSQAQPTTNWSAMAGGCLQMVPSPLGTISPSSWINR